MRSSVARMPSSAWLGIEPTLSMGRLPALRAGRAPVPSSRVGPCEGSAPSAPTLRQTLAASSEL